MKDSEIREQLIKLGNIRPRRVIDPDKVGKTERTRMVKRMRAAQKQAKEN